MNPAKLTPNMLLSGASLAAALCTAAFAQAPANDECTDALPIALKRAGRKHIRETAVVLRHGDAVLVERRGAGDWWAGLWDFPREAVGRRGRRLGTVTYSVTNHAVECEVRERSVARRTRPARGRRWLTPRALVSVAMSAPGRRIAALLKPRRTSGTLRSTPSPGRSS